jgi:indolepyruvate ferredoxin oxidoreductase
VRIPAGDAHLVLGADFVVTGTFDALAKIKAGQTDVIVNRHETMTADFSRKPDLAFPTRDLTSVIEEAAGPGRTTFLDATELATALTGDAIASNLFLLGFAVQRGLIPVTPDAIERAIELNNVAIAFNQRAFLWGRRAGHDLAAVERLTAPPPRPLSQSLDDVVARRVAVLTAYQDAAYAARYRALVDKVRAVETQRIGGTALTEAVARYAFKLMAYKDEYEVARLFTDGAFRRQLEDQFEGDYRIEFNLAPPVLANRDTATGHLRKRTFGPWMLTAMRLLARLKGLRGTAFDPFGRTAERRRERALIGDYETLVEELIEQLDRANHATAVELARIPEHIRGFGHVKDAHLATAKAQEAALLERFRNPSPAMATAAE